MLELKDAIKFKYYFTLFQGHEEDQGNPFLSKRQGNSKHIR